MTMAMEQANNNSSISCVNHKLLSSNVFMKHPEYGAFQLGTLGVFIQNIFVVYALSFKAGRFASLNQ